MAWCVTVGRKNYKKERRKKVEKKIILFVPRGWGSAACKTISQFSRVLRTTLGITTHIAERNYHNIAIDPPASNSLSPRLVSLSAPKKYFPELVTRAPHRTHYHSITIDPPASNTLSLRPVSPAPKTYFPELVTRAPHARVPLSRSLVLAAAFRTKHVPAPASHVAASAHSLHENAAPFTLRPATCVSKSSESRLAFTLAGAGRTPQWNAAEHAAPMRRVPRTSAKSAELGAAFGALELSSGSGERAEIDGVEVDERSALRQRAVHAPVIRSLGDRLSFLHSLEGLSIQKFLGD